MNGVPDLLLNVDHANERLRLLDEHEPGPVPEREELPEVALHDRHQLPLHLPLGKVPAPQVTPARALQPAGQLDDDVVPHLLQVAEHARPEEHLGVPDPVAAFKALSVRDTGWSIRL